MVLGSQCFPEEAVGESVTRFVGCFGEPVEQRTGIARQPKGTLHGPQLVGERSPSRSSFGSNLRSRSAAVTKSSYDPAASFIVAGPGQLQAQSNISQAISPNSDILTRSTRSPPITLGARDLAVMLPTSRGQSATSVDT